MKQLMSEATPPQTPPPGFLSAEEAADSTGAPTQRKVTLYLVRHGQTPYNVEKRLPGQLANIHLTEEGIRQAEQLGEALRAMPLTAIVSSPLERAQETAAIVRRAHPTTPLVLEPRLMDTDVGRWSGAQMDELSKSDPDWQRFAHRPTQPPEGIEGFYAVSARVVAAAEAARHNEELGDFIMLVAHADVIKLIITHYLRLPIEGAGWLHIPNASITVLAFSGERDPSVVALNWLPSPSWLRPAPPSPPTTNDPKETDSKYV
jgi:probable phosphoglycerate mutase